MFRLAFFLALTAFPPLMLPAQERLTEQEAAQLANRVISGLEETADLRKLDRSMFHPTFFEAPCELILLLPQEPCRQFTRAERFEFAASLVNLGWLMMEHLLALPDPFSREFEPPAEILAMMDEWPIGRGHDPPQSIEGLRAGIEALRRAQQVLLEERQRHDHIHQAGFRANLAAMQKALVQATADGLVLTPLEDLDPQSTRNAFPPNTYMFLAAPFAIFIAIDSEQPSIAWVAPFSGD
jgi:hypothetical protein